MPARFSHRLVLHISCICFQNIKIVCGKFSTEKVCECFFQVLLIIQLSLYNQIISNLMESTTFFILSRDLYYHNAFCSCRPHLPAIKHFSAEIRIRRSCG